MKNKMLEEICTFADECSFSDYGSFDICTQTYIDCKQYQEIIAQKVEEYNKKIKSSGVLK